MPKEIKTKNKSKVKKIEKNKSKVKEIEKKNKSKIKK
jgi:hypothetical protein